MLQYEYRGYNGHKPVKLNKNIEKIVGLSYIASLELFMILIEPFIETYYDIYTGENDLYDETGKINPDGNLTKHLRDRYNIIVQQVNDQYKSNNPVYIPIEKFVILPDLSFAAVLKDGTVMVEVDK